MSGISVCVSNQVYITKDLTAIHLATKTQGVVVSLVVVVIVDHYQYKKKINAG